MLKGWSSVKLIQNWQLLKKVSKYSFYVLMFKKTQVDRCCEGRVLTLHTKPDHLLTESLFPGPINWGLLLNGIRSVQLLHSVSMPLKLHLLSVLLLLPVFHSLSITPSHSQECNSLRLPISYLIRGVVILEGEGAAQQAYTVDIIRARKMPVEVYYQDMVSGRLARRIYSDYGQEVALQLGQRIVYDLQDYDFQGEKVEISSPIPGQKVIDLSTTDRAFRNKMATKSQIDITEGQLAVQVTCSGLKPLKIMAYSTQSDPDSEEKENKLEHLQAVYAEPQKISKVTQEKQGP